MTLSSGEEAEALLETEIADVSKLVLSVGKIAENCIGTWMPPEDDKRRWLVDEDGTWTELPGPCLINQTETIDLEKYGGVYWLPLAEKIK